MDNRLIFLYQLIAPAPDPEDAVGGQTSVEWNGKGDRWGDAGG